MGLGAKIPNHIHTSLHTPLCGIFYFSLENDLKGRPLQHVSPKNKIKVKPAQKTVENKQTFKTNPDKTPLTESFKQKSFPS